MSVFYLKRGDTLPILLVPLRDPDGTAHNLAGSTGWKLVIRLSDGSTLTRVMAKAGPDESGLLSYQWIASDWDAVSGGGAVGGLVVGPALPLTPGTLEHRMEYEVTGAGGERLTFPNGGDRIEQAYDVLRVWPDLA